MNRSPAWHDIEGNVQQTPSPTSVSRFICWKGRIFWQSYPEWSRWKIWPVWATTCCMALPLIHQIREILGPPLDSAPAESRYFRIGHSHQTGRWRGSSTRKDGRENRYKSCVSPQLVGPYMTLTWWCFLLKNHLLRTLSMYTAPRYSLIPTIHSLP